MNYSKYIVVKSLGMSGQDTIIVFPMYVRHDIMAKMFNNNIASAGFVNLTTRQCYGKSDTLKKESRSIDNDLLHALYPVE